MAEDVKNLSKISGTTERWPLVVLAVGLVLLVPALVGVPQFIFSAKRGILVIGDWFLLPGMIVTFQVVVGWILVFVGAIGRAVTKDKYVIPQPISSIWRSLAAIAGFFLIVAALFWSLFVVVFSVPDAKGVVRMEPKSESGCQIVLVVEQVLVATNSTYYVKKPQSWFLEPIGMGPSDRYAFGVLEGNYQVAWQGEQANVTFGMNYGGTKQLTDTLRCH
ncbi:hypothetical protein BK816_07835 [Boudabousia tangfeifanii]|uniref:Uncharacterized protein n=1 Tax=Boudabousia tangfeifanii TaxID=1912795 RepID=A0A1D9MLP0_9ACTO|nr:hypothetical protein [Boudabousia tangfeifanii]AOZ73212.1 hypothetical protein BK816_07835 [Boudabousia tangfeifanii]